MSMKLEDRKGAGAWLKTARNNAGLSMQALADAMGYPAHTSVNIIERGQSRVSEWQMPKLAQALGLPAEEVAKTLLKFYHPTFHKMLFEE